MGLCLESAGVTDYEEIKAYAFCPLDAAVVTCFETCSPSDVDSFYASVQSCGVEACDTTCRNKLQALAECVVEGACPYAASNDATTGCGFPPGLIGGFISFASLIYAVGIV